jgi:hypothetical protein
VDGPRPGGAPRPSPSPSPLIVGRLPSSYAAGLILAAAAWLGQFGGQAVIGAGEAFAARTPGPRVSRGRVTTLADYASPWSLGLVLSATAAFLVVAIPRLTAARPQPTLWLVACLASGALSLGALALAAWAAAQPQLAASDVGLRWDDHLRADTINGLVVMGPIAVAGFAGVAGVSAGLVGDPVWKWGVAVIGAVALLLMFVGRRRYARRLWSAGDRTAVGHGRR